MCVRLCGHPCANAANTQLRCTCRLGQPNLADQAHFGCWNIHEYMWIIWILCWQLFKVNSWNALRKHRVLMGALCLYVMDTLKWKGGVKHVNNTTRSFLLFAGLLWSFHVFSLFLTFPDLSWPEDTMQAVRFGLPLPQPTSLRSSRGRSRRLPGYMAPHKAAQLQNAMRCEAFFSYFFHGRLWKTMEDPNTLDRFGATWRSNTFNFLSTHCAPRNAPRLWSSCFQNKLGSAAHKFLYKMISCRCYNDNCKWFVAHTGHSRHVAPLMRILPPCGPFSTW